LKFQSDNQLSHTSESSCTQPFSQGLLPDLIKSDLSEYIVNYEILGLNALRISSFDEKRSLDCF